MRLSAELQTEEPIATEGHVSQATQMAKRERSRGDSSTRGTLFLNGEMFFTPFSKKEEGDPLRADNARSSVQLPSDVFGTRA